MPRLENKYWPQERWQHAAAVCQHLAVFFGGPHSSEPSFRRATVQPGDLLYPIGVRDQVLYVFGCMHVQEIIPPDGDDQQSPAATWTAANQTRQRGPPPASAWSGRCGGSGGRPAEPPAALWRARALAGAEGAAPTPPSCGELVLRGRTQRHGTPSPPAISRGERAGGCNDKRWSGGKPPTFRFSGVPSPLDQDLITIVTTQLTGIEAGQWTYRAILATVPPWAT